MEKVLIDALEKIANYKANSNSDPDVMGQALDDIQDIATAALHEYRKKERSHETQ